MAMPRQNCCKNARYGFTARPHNHQNPHHPHHQHHQSRASPPPPSPPSAPHHQQLLIGDRGYNLKLFVNEKNMTDYVCQYCGGVICDAAELSCINHQNTDIFAFCNKCLEEAIKVNNGRCPIDNGIPVIAPNRYLRGRIASAKVLCPNSHQYQQKISGYQACDDQKEGQIDCSWSGTLNELITHHLSKCNSKYEHNTFNKLKIENNKLKIENKNLEQKIKSLQMLQPNSFHQHHLITKCYWKWLDDGDVWKDYDPVYQQGIDRAFKNIRSKYVLRVNNKTYELCFRRMQQINCKTNFRRKIKRVQVTELRH